MLEAIAREKAIKKWRRDWKITLIEQANPEWHGLFETLNAQDRRPGGSGKLDPRFRRD